jgi:hypothetical protein
LFLISKGLPQLDTTLRVDNQKPIKQEFSTTGYNSFSGVFADGILPEIDRLHTDTGFFGDGSSNCGSGCISTPNTNCSSNVNGVVVTKACTPIYSIRGHSVTFTNSRAEKNQRVFMTGQLQ